ncbi:MerR family transcriptional regulator [Chromobacterium vaccinii]|uniref:HTH merR-type domain-containing protein n=1 Tax=Chromobacterium vaccinii TaxID=1108595 RepID=A0A1D9LLB6_9NEIS|nr:MerR family transcriptional regulator [Chromobacterium vaccinii]AOZ52047.1 hypothetical protein BKX93_19990 [Chromobacterium vaccinii]QND86321.1 Uncharacterized protein ChrSW_4095 [Chromobacterium vaccinii]QND91552.1 Uncharacterized protein ChrSV_4095 [Chromobacterium vaccinii]
MRISELAEKTGISPRMLRYYEQQGLIHPLRTQAGYRQYGDKEIWILQSIKMLQQAGLTLNVIRPLMSCITSQTVRFSPCPQVLAKLREEHVKITQTIAKLSQALGILETYLKEAEQFATNDEVVDAQSTFKAS